MRIITTVVSNRPYCAAQVDLTLENKNRLEAMPGFSKWEKRDRLFRPTGANVGYIQEHWPDAEWSASAEVFRQEWRDELARLEDNRELKKQVLTDDTGFVFKTEPRSHQRQAFVLSRDQKNFALLMGQGTGKTKVIWDTAAYLYGKGLIDALITVAVNGVHINWIIEEMPKHCPCPVAAYYQTAGESMAKSRSLEAVLATTDRLRAITMNVEGFMSQKQEDLLERCLSSMRCLLVIDESTRIKTPGAKRTQILTQLGKQAAYRRILTGTPITKGVEDLYAQFKFLDPMILGFDSFYTFRNHFCNTYTLGEGKSQHTIITGYKNLDELYAILEGSSFRVLKEQCLDIPPKVYKRWPFELTKTQRRVYDELETNFMAELDGDTIAEELPITRLMRLQQIASNWWPGGTDGESTFRAIDKVNPRLQAVKHIVQETEGKIIFWARFRPDLELIQQELGGACVSYHGGISDRKKLENANSFKNDPKTLYMAANQASAAWGHNWTMAETEVYYSNSFDLEQREQSEDRAHRDGQKNTVQIYDLEALRTMDRKIIRSLRSKKDIAEMVLRDPRSFFLMEEQTDATV